MSLQQKAVSLIVINGLSAVATLVVLVVCSHTLSAYDYGSYRQFFVLYEVAVPFFGLGLAQAIFYFFALSGQKLEVLNRVLAVLVLSVGVFAVLVVGGRDFWVTRLFHNESLHEILPLVIPFTLASLIVPVLSAVFVDRNQSRRLAVYSVAYVLVLALLVTLTLLVYRDFKLAIYVRVATVSAFAVVLYLACRKELRTPRAGETHGDAAGTVDYAQILHYSIPLGVAGAAGIASQQVDKVVVSMFASPDIFAIYSNGAIEIPLIGILTGALATASVSDLSQKIRGLRYREALEVFRKIAELSSLLLIPAFVYFFVCAEDFMAVLFGDPYRQSALPFRIYLCLIPARVVFYGPALIAFGKSKTILIRSVVELILNAVLSVCLAVRFGYMGVAVATVLVTYLWSIAYNFWELRRCFQVRYRDLLPFKALSVRLVVALAASPALLAARGVASPSGPLAGLVAAFAAYAVGVALLFHCTGVLKAGTVLRLLVRR